MNVLHMDYMSWGGLLWQSYKAQNAILQLLVCVYFTDSYVNFSYLIKLHLLLYPKSNVTRSLINTFIIYYSILHCITYTANAIDYLKKFMFTVSFYLLNTM